MHARTNNSNSVSVSRTANPFRTGLRIALAAAALGLAPMSVLADNAKATSAQAVATKAVADVTIRPVQDSIPDRPATISPDYNQDGVVTIEDLFDYLTGWMAGKPGADTNLNGVLEIQDVLDYINIWFNAYGTKVHPDPRH